MTATRNPHAKWTLPTVVNPPSRKCFTILVPNERFHIAAFRGALLSLGSAYNWADDPAHTAKDVANVWKDVIVNVSECGGAAPYVCPFDFIPSDSGWHVVIDANVSPNYRGAHNPGTGWETTYAEQVSGGNSMRTVYIEIIFAYPVNVLSLAMQYNLVKGTFVQTGFTNAIVGYLGGSAVLVRSVPSETDPDGLNKLLVASSSGVMCDSFRLGVTCGVENKPANPGGGAVVTYFEIGGTGANPCS